MAQNPGTAEADDRRLPLCVDLDGTLIKSDSLFDARAGAGAHVNLELAGVHRRKKVLAEPGRKQPYRTNGEEQKEQKKNARMIDTQRKQAQVCVAKARKAALEGQLKTREGIAALLLACGFRVVVLLQQILCLLYTSRCV